MSQDEVLMVIKDNPGITASELKKKHFPTSSLGRFILKLEKNRLIIADKSNRKKYKYYPI